jgi:O-antigen/teichoic acid export membrane protein
MMDEELFAHRRSEAKRVISNAIALMLARPLTWLSATGLTILLPRYLGDANLGKINAAFVFADWCGLLVSLGITAYLTKEVARRGAEAGALVLNALLLRIALALIVGAGAAVIVTLISYDTVTRQLVYLATLHILLIVISGVLTGALQGMQHLKVVASIDALSKSALLGFVAVFLIRDFGVIGVPVAYILSDIIGITLLLGSLVVKKGINGPINVRSWKSLLTGGTPFFVWEAALLTYARIDVLMLSLFASSAVLGWYSAAYRIINIPLFLPSILMTVIFPALSANAGHPTTFNSLARRGVLIAAVTSMPMAFGLILLADKVIDLFGYPTIFSNSVVPIMCLAASLPLVAINMIVASALVSLDKQRQWALVGVGAAVINPALNLLLIPLAQSQFGNGGIGAGAVTTLTEIYLVIAGFILLPKDVLDKATYVGILRCLAAGLAMAAVLWIADPLSIFVLVPLGALVYGVGVVLLGAVSREDLRFVREYIGIKTGGGVPVAGV